MQVGEDAAPWLPRVLHTLKETRGPSYRLWQVALFDGEAGQQYLVLSWKFSFEGSMGIMEFHRVEVDDSGRVQLTILREMRSWLIWLVWPSGETVFPGEATVAVVKFGSGGSGSEGYGYRLIQMKRNTVDITPDGFGRTADLADIDRDGVFEAVVVDMRWRAWFDSRGAAGPHVPVFLERRDEVFEPACKEHADIILRHIGVYEDALARNDRWPYEWQAQIMLNRLQLGQFAEARAAYEQLLDSVDRLGNEYIPTVAEISRDVDPLFDSGQVVVDESCVLNALPPETVRSGERVRTLRYHYKNWAP